MKKISQYFRPLLFAFAAYVFATGSVLRSQTVCNSTGNLMIFTNYDGGTLTINVDVNIPNLKIGICSYEACAIFLTGAFVSNVTGVHYAGYNSPNTNCAGSSNSITSTYISGAPMSAATTTVYSPNSPISNSNGWPQIICGYSCINNSNQGGCNTVDQVEAYFLAYFSGSTLYAHKVQYNCWTGSHTLSGAGNCCPIPTLLPGSIGSSQSFCAGNTPSGFTSNAAASGGAGTITYTWQSSTTSPSSGFTNISSANAPTYNAPALSTTTYYRRAASTSVNTAVYSNVITVTVLPVPQIMISGGNTFCLGTSATLTASGGNSYLWQPMSSPVNSVAITPSGNTVYTVQVGATNGCSATAVHSVFVVPTPTVTITASKNPICEGEFAMLTAQGANSYNWTSPSQSGSTAIVAPTITTTFTLTAQANNGCFTIMPYVVTVNPPPVIGITAPSSTLCSGKTMVLSASGGTGYIWSPGSANTPTLSVTGATNSSYSVTGYDANNCTGSASISLIVFPSPTVQLTASKSTICDGESVQLTGGGAPNYTWSADGLEGNPVNVKPAQPAGNYTVTGVGANGCSNTATAQVMVLACTGVNEQAAEKPTARIFPNPSNGEFSVRYELRTEIRVINSLGDVVRTSQLTEKNNFTANITGLPPGIYIVAGGQGESAFTRKVIVSR